MFTVPGCSAELGVRKTAGLTAAQPSFHAGKQHHQTVYDSWQQATGSSEAGNTQAGPSSHSQGCYLAGFGGSTRKEGQEAKRLGDRSVPRKAAEKRCQN